MPIEYFVVLTYAIATFFLMSLAGSLGLVMMLRRMRLDAQLRTPSQQLITGMQHNAPLILREDKAWWRNNRIYSALRDSNTPTTPMPPILPPRYQQTLLYSDTINSTNFETDTHPSLPMR